MDADLATIIGTSGVGGGVLIGFARWGLNLWATVRREGIEANKAAAAAGRADNERMVEALLEQAKSNATLAVKIEQLTEQLTGKLERLLERTGEVQRVDPDYVADRPPSKPRQRRTPAREQTAPYRMPKRADTE